MHLKTGLPAEGRPGLRFHDKTLSRYALYAKYALKMQNLQNMFCVPCILPRTWCSTRRSTAAVDLFGRGAALNSVLFDSGIA